MTDALAAPTPLHPTRIGLYAVGSLGTGLFSTIPTVLLLYYCTETLALPAAIASALVLLPKAWSIAWDPFVGAWSDNLRSPWGRRAPFLLIGATGVAAGFAALFSAPPLSESALIAWVGASYFLLATLYSLYAVPYIALPAEIAHTNAARSSLVSWRMVAGMAGVFVGAAAAPALVSAFGGGRAGYAMMSWVVALFCFAAMATPLAVAPTDRATSAPRTRPSFWRGARDALQARGFVFLAGAYFLMITSVGVLTASMPYLVARALQRPESDISVAMAALLGSAVVTPPLWTFLGKRFGEKRALMSAIALFCIVTLAIGAAVAFHTPWTSLLFIFAAGGFAFAGLQVLPFAMLAHLAHNERREHNRALEATFTGLWTASEKLGLAVGPALVGGALAIGGVGAVAALVAGAPPALLGAAALCLVLQTHRHRQA